MNVMLCFKPLYYFNKADTEVEDNVRMNSLDIICYTCYYTYCVMSAFSYDFACVISMKYTSIFLLNFVNFINGTNNEVLIVLQLISWKTLCSYFIWIKSMTDCNKLTYRKMINIQWWYITGRPIQYFWGFQA